MPLQAAPFSSTKPGATDTEPKKKAARTPRKKTVKTADQAEKKVDKVMAEGAAETPFMPENSAAKPSREQPAAAKAEPAIDAAAGADSAAGEPIEAVKEPMKETKAKFSRKKHEPTEEHKENFKQDMLRDEWSDLARSFQPTADDDTRIARLKFEQQNYEKFTYTPAQLKDKLAAMKKSGQSKHVLFEMPEAMRRTWRAKLLRLQAVYAPMMVGIPIMLEFGDMQAMFGAKADTMVMLLTGMDVYIVLMSVMLYTYQRKLVSKIEYDCETEKVFIRQEHGSEFLRPVEHELAVKEIEKFQGKTFNKTLGYRSLKKGDNHRRFGTVSPGVIWHDQKLFDSLISQPGERLKDAKRRKNWRESKKNKRLLVD